MNSEKLNQMFATAREIPVETTPEQIANWVGVAAASTTGVVGIAAKLKLLIAKKSFIMLGISLGTVGVVVMSAALIGSAPSKEKKTEPSKQVLAATVADSNEFENPPQPPTPNQLQELAVNGQIEAPPMPILPDGTVPAKLPMPPSFTPPIQKEADEFLPFVHSEDRKSKIGFFQQDNDKGKNKKKGRRNVKGNGEVIKQERSVKPFSELNISGIFDVIITQGAEEKVVVETDSNLQELVTVENDGSALKLSNKRASIKKMSKMIVYVTVKDISKIKNSGIGDVECENSLKSKTLDLVLSNVGDVSVDINCDQLNIEFTGVGDLKMKGKAANAKINNEAVGDMKAFDLQVETMNMTHTGVGDASINVSQSLTLDFRGVGDVYYKGNPATKEITKNGVGEVKKRP